MQWIRYNSNLLVTNTTTAKSTTHTVCVLHAYTCRHIAEHSKLCVHFRLLSLVCFALEYHMRYQNIYTVTHSFHGKNPDFRWLCYSGGRQNLITIWRWLNITSEFLIFPSNFFSDSHENGNSKGKPEDLTSKMIQIPLLVLLCCRIIHPKKYYRNYLAHSIRPDGREFDAFRPIRINVKSIGTADGSSIVKLGNTTVVCGIKAVKFKSENPKLSHV